VSVAAVAPEYLKACCAELWAHPGVRLLAGDHLHPGGRELTDRALDILAAPSDAWILDLGCGPGATASLAAARGHRVVALDRSMAAAAEAGEAAGVGAAAADAERLPVRTGTVDGVVAECVVSALPEKEAAVREVARVLRPGGRFVLADVIREGPLPAELDSFVAWLACAGGALSSERYVALLEGTGLEVILVEEHAGALMGLVDQVRRRLALFQAAVSTGVVDSGGLGLPGDLLEVGQRLLTVTREAAEQGRLSYALMVARC
jgi:SAM-dependent methyltransferase